MMGCSEKTVRTKLLKRGLPHLRIGNNLRFRVSDVQEFQEDLIKQANASTKDEEGVVSFFDLKRQRGQQEA